MTNQITLLRDRQIWVGCALVPLWWKTFDTAQVHISHVCTAVVKLTSHLYLMKVCAFWELEFLGIKEKAEALRTVEERAVVPHVAEKLKFENRRYWVEMP